MSIVQYGTDNWLDSVKKKKKKKKKRKEKTAANMMAISTSN